MKEIKPMVILAICLATVNSAAVNTSVAELFGQWTLVAARIPDLLIYRRSEVISELKTECRSFNYSANTDNNNCTCHGERIPEVITGQTLGESTQALPVFLVRDIDEAKAIDLSHEMCSCGEDNYIMLQTRRLVNENYYVSYVPTLEFRTLVIYIMAKVVPTNSELEHFLKYELTDERRRSSDLIICSKEIQSPKPQEIAQNFYGQWTLVAARIPDSLSYDRSEIISRLKTECRKFEYFVNTDNENCTCRNESIPEVVIEVSSDRPTQPMPVLTVKNIDEAKNIDWTNARCDCGYNNYVMLQARRLVNKNYYVSYVPSSDLRTLVIYIMAKVVPTNSELEHFLKYELPDDLGRSADVIICSKEIQSPKSQEIAQNFYGQWTLVAARIPDSLTYGRSEYISRLKTECRHYDFFVNTDSVNCTCHNGKNPEVVIGASPDQPTLPLPVLIVKNIDEAKIIDWTGARCTCGDNIHIMLRAKRLVNENYYVSYVPSLDLRSFNIYVMAKVVPTSSELEHFLKYELTDDKGRSADVILCSKEIQNPKLQAIAQNFYGQWTLVAARVPDSLTYGRSEVISTLKTECRHFDFFVNSDNVNCTCRDGRTPEVIIASTLGQSPLPLPVFVVKDIDEAKAINWTDAICTCGYNNSITLQPRRLVNENYFVNYVLSSDLRHVVVYVMAKTVPDSAELEHFLKNVLTDDKGRSSDVVICTKENENSKA